jgi:hypothetical protein
MLQEALGHAVRSAVVITPPERDRWSSGGPAEETGVDLAGAGARGNISLVGIAPEKTEVFPAREAKPEHVALPLLLKQSIV